MNNTTEIQKKIHGCFLLIYLIAYPILAEDITARIDPMYNTSKYSRIFEGQQIDEQVILHDFGTWECEEKPTYYIDSISGKQIKLREGCKKCRQLQRELGMVMAIYWVGQKSYRAILFPGGTWKEVNAYFIEIERIFERGWSLVEE